MESYIKNAIAEILENRKDLLKIALIQKAKFEGWLKFELATYLDKKGMKNVFVEKKKERRRDRSDISFEHNYYDYDIELKTPNTNWKIPGVVNKGRPITKNLKSIVADAKKLNSSYGIVAFVLFPLPEKDARWEEYIKTISLQTGIDIDINLHCIRQSVNLDESKVCDLLICAFKSKVFESTFSW